MNKQEKLNNLLTKYRLYYFNQDQNGINRLFGLKDLIEENFTKDMIGCEVGSFAGVSSELFALYVKKIYCVDQWEAYGIENGRLIDGAMPVDKLKEAEKMFDEMIMQYNNIEKIKMSSESASELFKINQFDFVYLDAAHDYENVKKDIKNWLPKIKHKGIICGHDYTLIPTVKQAVDEFFELKDIKLYNDSSWCVKIN